MKIDLKEITIRELVKGYMDNEDDGVIGYDGKLDIRPPYQREFVYGPKERDAVIGTVDKEFPLNVMYWAVRDDGNYEIIDGQQRTLSICQYVNGDFSYMMKYFHNRREDEKEKFLDYKLMIYFCTGTDSERLHWFRTINIAGLELTDQELRNAVYSGTWVTDAKRYFSKNGCPVYGLAGDYLSGSANRQAYLETGVKWISDGNIEVYMGNHQHDTSASKLWLYFQEVINWVKTTFPNYRREMKGIEWGYLYNNHKQLELDPKKLEKEISSLMMDDDVTKKRGIYQYLLTGKEKYLNIRAFTPSQKRRTYERQNGACPMCGEQFEFNQMQGDHIIPWSKGGKTRDDNCQMLCAEDNRAKLNI